MPARVDAPLLASELRIVLGQMLRRARSEQRLPVPHAAVLGRIDRDGTRSISDLAAAERVRPQSMAQTVGELEADGLVRRRPDPTDARRILIELTPAGVSTLAADRAEREGWLATAIERDLTAHDRDVLRQAIDLMRRLAQT